jgi:hypothetical protein
MNICVITSLGRMGEAEPRAFFVGTRRLIVAGVLDRWVLHPHRFYEVACEDGRRFLLRHDSVRMTWELAGVFAAKVPAPKAAKPKAQPAGDATSSPLQPKRWWSALRRA